jgi:hypothetical protein
MFGGVAGDARRPSAGQTAARADAEPWHDRP